MSRDLLTPQAAFNAMRTILIKEFGRNAAADIGGLLGETERLSDGGTADPAAWSDWLDTINAVSDSSPKDALNISSAYSAMRIFLLEYCKRTHSPNIAKLVEKMNDPNSSNGKNTPFWIEWNAILKNQVNSTSIQDE